MNKIITNLNIDTSSYEPLENTNWGFTTFSEKINGRLAMMAFIIWFGFEFITKEKIVNLLN